MNTKILSAALAASVAFGLGAAPSFAVSLGRIGGVDRYDTAVQIASRTFMGHQDTVYIARGDLPVDALVAGQLTDGPVLLSPLGQVNPRTLQALQEYSPKEVIFLGKAFPASTIDAYRTPGAQSKVIGGNDRQETSALIAERAFKGKSSHHLYVAAPDGVDAVASGALTDAPIVLAYPDGRVPSVAGLPADTERVCIGAACNYVSAEERLQGEDRFETAVLIAKRAFPKGFTEAYAGRSDDFIDAVVGGTLTDAPILLIRPSGQDSDRINALKLTHVTLLGGYMALPDDALTLVASPDDLSEMTPQQMALYAQAHIEEFEVELEKAIQERLPENRLNLDRNPELIAQYREWASGMPRDEKGAEELDEVYSIRNKSGYGSGIQHLQNLVPNIVTQVMPSYKGSAVYEGILADMSLPYSFGGAHYTLKDAANMIADGYKGSAPHWRWVRRAGASGTSFVCGASAVNTHGPWFHPDTNGVTVGDSVLTVSCGSLDMPRVAVHY